MRLGANTGEYEVAKVPIKEALGRVRKFGFELVDIPARDSADPTHMSASEIKTVVKTLTDLGLRSSQLLLSETMHIASSDSELRRQTIEYMKRCGDFQLELGGKQVLVCWGCGVYEKGVNKERSWLNAVESIREFAEWSLDKGLLVDLELDPHVYFINNSLAKMAKMIEDVEMPNVFANIDIGHICITREEPKEIEKLKSRILHAHLSETDTFQHTNSILGLGTVDFKSYVDKLIELGIDDNCAAYGEIAVGGIEIGSREGVVDDPDRWVKESLSYITTVLPDLDL